MSVLFVGGSLPKTDSLELHPVVNHQSPGPLTAFGDWEDGAQQRGLQMVWSRKSTLPLSGGKGWLTQSGTAYNVSGWNLNIPVHAFEDSYCYIRLAIRKCL